MKRIERTSVRPATRPIILYVEDEDENWEVALLLLGARYELHRAATDEQACRQLFAYRDKLVAILMDIQLKGSTLNGLQLTRIFRGDVAGDLPAYARRVEPVKVPIFFVTAYTAAYSERTLLSSGADGVLAKPVEFMKLTRALTEVHMRKIERS